MDKKIILRYFVPAGILCLGALVLAHFAMGWLPYPLLAAGVILGIIGTGKMKPGWALCSGGLLALALALRFAARGYAWWGYALAFAAALIVLHHFLPLKLWRVLLVLVGILCAIAALIFFHQKIRFGGLLCIALIVISFGGAMLGSRIPGLNSKKAGIVGGLVLIGIGVKLLVEGVFLK